MALSTAAFALVVNPVSVVSTGVDAFSCAATGKGATDHALSAVAEEDWRLRRGLKGDDVCKTEDTPS
ncbi:MAG: hypothetical protein VW268_05245 [Rhodospirillaceae bacterium]